MKKTLILWLCVLILYPVPLFAAGLFGPPQTRSQHEGGLNTAVAYQYVEDTFQTALTDHVARQHQIYSQAAWGQANRWEIYGRIGVSDLRIADAFRSHAATTWTSRSDFQENWKFFGSLGARVFYPLTGRIGMGIFVEGTYHFSNYTDDIKGAYGATPFLADLKIKNLWDLHAGAALEASLIRGVRLYGGPFVYHTQACARLPAPFPGLVVGARENRLTNKTPVGGFIGLDIPLAKGFGLQIEGRMADRFAIGSAITYTY